MSEWLSIDTAPRDGTWIIGIEDGDDEEMYKCNYVDSSWFDYTESRLLCLSHWIPMPSAPSKKKHMCKSPHHPITCFTNDIGGLNLMSTHDKVSYVTQVVVCPFCGEKS